MAPPPPSQVKRVAIVGTGIIGSGWAAVFAARGFTVTAYVRSSASEEKFLRALANAWQKLLDRGIASGGPSGWRSVKCVRDLAQAVGDADYVQESVVEDLTLKQSIIAQIDRLTPRTTLIGTSSSFIPLSLVRARASKHPERIATAHPTIPAWDDFVECLGADAAKTQWLASFFNEAVGMDAITMKKEMHGHVINAIQNSLCTTSTALVNAGVVDAPQLDRALLHLQQMGLAAGGISHALVGMVGGGSEAAMTELATDIIIGVPVAWVALLINWTLGSGRLASFLLWLLHASTSWLTSSSLLKRAVGWGVGWWNAPVYAQWDSSPQALAAFERNTMRRLCALRSLPELSSTSLTASPPPAARTRPAKSPSRARGRSRERA